MSANLARSLSILFGEEGGYVNDPQDPGGETIYGITRRDHPDLWTNGPPTREQAAERYRTHYWDMVKADELPWPLCLYVFDAAVNQGVEAAVGLLQKTLGLVRDGILGPVTLAAAKRATPETCALYLADRALRYTGTRNADKFLRGWLKRLFVMAMEAT